MSSQIRVGPATDDERYLASDLLVWADEVGQGTTEQLLLGVPREQRFAAELDGDVDPGTYPGIYGVRPMTLSAPGPSGLGATLMPCAGLTWVGVHPDHRRRGVLTAMLRDHFERTREAGVAVSALHASEPAIYGRHGYGLASIELQVKLGRGTTLVAPHLDEDASLVRTQLATITDSGMAERARACEEHVAANAVGAIVGASDFYERIHLQLPPDLRDKEPVRVLFARRDGHDVGMAGFRRTPKWELGRPGGEVEVFKVFGDPAARLALLRRLTDLDLMGTVKVWGVGGDDPLLLWIGGPRGAAEVHPFDSLWIRLVDLPAALTARGYAEDCDVVVEVTDEAAPWNAGRWRLHVADGVASVEKSSAEAVVRLPVQALGAAYLGVGNLVTRHRAGLLQEQRPGAARELWRALRTDVAPVAAAGF